MPGFTGSFYVKSETGADRNGHFRWTFTDGVLTDAADEGIDGSGTSPASSPFVVDSDCSSTGTYTFEFVNGYFRGTGTQAPIIRTVFSDAAPITGYLRLTFDPVLGTEDFTLTTKQDDNACS